MKRNQSLQGFTLVEIAVGIALLGLVLLAFAGMTNLVQKGAGKTRDYTDAQQNARAALDYLTSQLREAGSDVAAYDGQGTVVSAGPYQIAFNADIDAGQTIQGEVPLTAIDQSKGNNTVPVAGTAIYTPAKTYAGGAETVVFTLDSNGDGKVDIADHGDQDEEKGHNANTYVLEQYRYGATGGANVVRTSNIAMVRGPVKYDDGTNPAPLFEYFYDDDNKISTPDKLWGDTDGDGELSSSEVDNLTDMPAADLGSIRMVKVNVAAESNGTGDTKDNGGHAHVTMSSRVYIRNADSHAATIYGTVYYDANANGKKDSGETGLSNVTVKISETGRKTTSDPYGQYSLAVDPGTWTVVQTVPTGYTAQSPASVKATITKGESKIVDFADKTAIKSGYIVGTVWNDADGSGVKNGSEVGQPDVVLSLSNGMTGKSKANGYYRITAPLGSYTLTENLPVGYSSTTSTSASCTLVNAGDSVVTNFGVILGAPKGTLSGYVYVDANKDGILNNGEKGIKSVTMQLSNNMTTTTDNSGYYEFKVDAGKYDLYEQDAQGYTSTTPNIISTIPILVNQTVTENFGDILMKDLTFVEVAVSNTKRPLSVSVADFKEDDKGDNDIILGTPSSATNNIFLYLNKYVDGSTPLTSLFNSTADKSYKATNDVNAIKWMERSGDDYMDVLSGVELSGNNVQDWYNDPKKIMLGKASNAPNKIASSGSSCATTRFYVNDMNGDGMPDLVVGLKSKVATWAGGFEEQLALAPGSYTSKQVTTQNGKGTTLGIVSGIAAGDVDKDGDMDLVVASNNGNTWGHIDIFLNDGKGTLTWTKRLLAKGGVNDVAVADMQNDGTGEPDILVAVTNAQNVGGVQVWLNKSGVYGVDDKTGYKYNSDEDAKVPDKVYDTSGEAQFVTTSKLDADIYPENISGTRSSSFYTGSLFVIQEPGTTNEKISNVKVNVAGEVVSFDIADMNNDGYKDIVVTTRTSASAGKLAIYFLNQVYALP